MRFRMFLNLVINMSDTAYFVCQECYFAILYDDYVGLDCYYSPEELEHRIETIKSGIARLGSNLRPGVRGYLSQKTPCDCCGVSTRGPRYEIIKDSE